MTDPLKAMAYSKEAEISDSATQVHLARQFIRFSKMQKLCSNPVSVKILEEYKRKTLELMGRQHV